MNKYVSRGLLGTLFVGGITLLGSTAANAADTTGQDGLISGNQLISSVTAPITATGNAISLVGDSQSNAAVAAPAPAAPAPAPAPVRTSGSDAVAAGNQVVADVAAPVTANGNAVSILGDSQSNQAVTSTPVAAPAAPSASPTTDGDDSVAGGNQVVPALDSPINLGGNAISLVGDSQSNGSMSGNGVSTGTGSGAGSTTVGDDSVAGGNQVIPVVTLPVDVGGNAISVLGDSQSNGSTSGNGVSTGTGSATGSTTTGDDSVAGGNQVVPVVTLPVNVGGNAISVLGDSQSNGSMSGNGASTGTGSGAGSTTVGDDSVAGGNQVASVVTLPVNVGGNAISVLGDSQSNGSMSGNGASTGSGSGTGSTTTGDDSVAGGNQVIPVVTLPVNVGGNAISVLGDSQSNGSTSGNGVSTGSGSGTGSTTTGDDSVAGGNQVVPVVNVPVSLGGNAISVVGDSETNGPATGDDGSTDPTDPTTPTDPTDPTIPTDPTGGDIPTDPTTPTTPVDTTVPTGTTTAGGSSTIAAAALSDSARGSLAFTGSDGGMNGALGALFVLLAGLGLTVIARRAARS